jgi:transposase
LVERVEIVAGKERRRRWSDEERQRLVAEAFAPGAVVAHVARRHGVAESCFYAWRKRYANDAGDGPRLIPVMVADTPATVPSRRVAPPPSSTAAVITLPDGTRVEIAGDYPRATLRALIAALRRAP